MYLDSEGSRPMNETLRKKIVAWSLFVPLTGGAGWFAANHIPTREQAGESCTEIQATADQISKVVQTTTTTTRPASEWQRLRMQTNPPPNRQWLWQAERLSRIVSNHPACFTADAVATAESYLVRLNQP